MAVRTDIKVYPQYSPRIIVVEAPSIEVTVQDLYDTLRAWEDSPEGHDYELPLIDAGGKEDLGGGVFVGISATLQNARLMFAARNTPVESGTVTTADTDGAYLNDSAADFVAAGLIPGDLVINRTDNSKATILNVTTNQLFTFGLEGGSDNQFELGDAYDAYRLYECDIFGGNLVAVDDSEPPVPIAAIYATFGTAYTRTSSASATIAQLEIDQLVERIEGLRDSHRSTGNSYYWDPVNGDDGNNGLSDSTAVKTFAKAQTLVTSGNNDVIQALSTSSNTVATENITITKDGLAIRGPGPGRFKILPANDAVPTCTVAADNVALDGIRIDGEDAGSATCVLSISNADRTLLSNMIVEHAPNNALCISDARHTTLDDIIVEHVGQHAIYLTDNAYEVTIKDVKPHNITGTGIRMDGVGISECAILGAGTAVYSCDTGIYLGAGTTNTILDARITVTGNTTADITDLGTSTNYSGIDHAVLYGGKVAISASLGETGTIYPRGTSGRPVNNLTDAKAIADYYGFKEFYIDDALTITGAIDMSDWTFTGKSHVHTTVTVDSAPNVVDTLFRQVKITGALDGGNEINDCVVEDLTYINGHVHRSGLKGTITLNGAKDAVLVECSAIDPTTPPTIDMNVSGQNLVMPNYSGIIQIQNMAGSAANVGLNGGRVILKSTVTGGTVNVSGSGTLVDEHGNPIPSGTWNGGVTVSNETISTSGLVEAGWTEVYVDAVNGAAGTDYPLGRTPSTPTNNLTDATTIANASGIARIRVRNLITAPPTADLSGLTVLGYNVLSDIVVLVGAATDGTNFERVTVTTGGGVLSGTNHNFVECAVSNVSGVDGVLFECALFGTIAAAAGGEILAKGCNAADNPVYVDLGAAGSACRMELSGDVELINLASATDNTLSLHFGTVVVGASNTDGTVTVAGTISDVFDADSGGTVVVTNAVSTKTVVEGNWEKVYLDTTNGGTGTAYPMGRRPGSSVNNLADALAIATANSLKTIHVTGTVPVLPGQDVSEFTLEGHNVQTDIIAMAGGTTDKTNFERVTVTSAGGPLTGSNQTFTECIVASISGINGVIFSSGLFGILGVAAGGEMLAKDCNAADDPVYIDLGAAGSSCRAHLSGDIEVVNLTSATDNTLSMDFGTVVVGASNTAGTVTVAGTCFSIDDSLSGGTTVVNNAVNPQTTRDAVWDESLALRDTYGTLGGAINRLVQGLYNGQVYIDFTSAYSGATLPVGTLEQPVNNIVDAKAIADSLGYKTYRVLSYMTLGGVDHPGWTFVGGNAASGIRVMSENVDGAKFINMFVGGVMSGTIAVEGGVIGDTTGVEGWIDDSLLVGNLTIVGDTALTKCSSGIPGNASPELTFSGAAAGLNLRAYSGGIKFYSMVAGNIATAEFVAGRCRIDTSCVGGELNIRGVVDVVDNSTGTLVRRQAQISETSIARSVWDALETAHTVAGSFGVAATRVRKFVTALLSNL